MTGSRTSSTPKAIGPLVRGENASPPARSADRFRLDGPSIPLDPRIHAFRSDIADVALAGSLFAPHYARPDVVGCAAITAVVRTAPNDAAAAVSELIRGESFAVLDVAGVWAWGYCRHDHYVGYVRCDALGEPTVATHVVSAPAALLFAEPNIKSRVRERLPMGARFAALRDGHFFALDEGYIHARHAQGVDTAVSDPVLIAERLIGAPYLWGGRSGDGVDCSGLVQLAFAFSGRPVPRDSDQQSSSVGSPLEESAPLRRGDLVFFPGHVGLMADAETIVHANAFWMAVIAEPLADIVARGYAITGRRRP